MSDKILKLDQAQTLYQDLRERIDVLPTNEDITVTDVQINGTSILSNGVANVPMGSTSDYGVFKLNLYGGLQVGSDGMLKTNGASASLVKSGTDATRPLTPMRTSDSAFYGLAKAAGTDMKDIANTTVGVYPDAQKEAIQQMLGVSQMLAPENSNLVASQAYAIGDVFTANGKLYKATNAIAQDAAIIPGTNCTETTIVDESIKDVQVNGVSILQDGVANVPKSAGTTLGVVKTNYMGVEVNANGELYINKASSTNIKDGSNTYRPIVSSNQHEASFYGLAKAAGVDMASSNNSVGTYTNDAKVAIRNMIGALGISNISGNGLYVNQDIETGNVYLGADVEDVQVNGTSVVSNSVANIPIASTSGLGVVQIDSSLGIGIDSSSHKIFIDDATVANVKAGTEPYKPIVPRIQDAATFYGLAKAAGADMASSNNSVGTYTDEAKSAIRSMLGVQNFNPQSIAIVANGDTHAAITSGQYVYVQNHSTLTEGLYSASSAIAANETLSTSNLTAVGSGGLNALLGKIPEQLIYLGTETNYPLSAAHTEYPIGITLMYTLSSTSYPYGMGTVVTIRSAAARCVQFNFSNSPDDYKLRTADSNGWSDWKSLKDVPGITDLQKATGIVVDGNKAATVVTLGQFVILKNSTISGKVDGLYTAAKAIPANTAIDGTYLTAVSGGGLNAIKNDLTYKGNTIKELLITEIGSYSGFYAAGYRFFLLHVEGNPSHMRDYMIPVGIDKFGFSAEIMGSSTIYVKVEGLWHENGVLDINTLETSTWSGATIKLIGII